MESNRAGAQRRRSWASSGSWLALVVTFMLLEGCSKTAGVGGVAGDATPTTLAANTAFAKALPLDDSKDFEDAKRGLVAKPGGKILGADGAVLRDFDAYGFLAGKAADTVNPSLWRHAQLNANFGLFKVMEGVYQLRGFDIANITLIEGKTVWIVVDTLTSRETATRAMAFARQHLGDRKVSAVIFTHSHADHFGGALGVIPAEEAAARQIPVVAPVGFMEEATSENLLMGIAMGRRSMYMYGSRLERSAKGLVDDGLGKAVAYGSVGILAPNQIVSKTPQEITIDGLRFVFQNVPGSEAPAELTFSIPELKAFCGAEMVSHTMHNLYTLRGAKVRDAMKWAGYIDDAIGQAADAEVYFGSHTGRCGAGSASASS